MATSGSTNFTLNARQIVTFALKKLRVVRAVEDPAAEDMADGIEDLNVMLKGWQLRGPNLFRYTEGSLTLTAATQSYQLPTAYRIVSARYRNAGGNDLPMNLLTREEYFDLPLKSTAGAPNSYYFDPQMATGTLYVWPVLAAPTTETIQYTYQRRFEDVDDADNDIDIPQEYLETVGYSLASRLADNHGTEQTTWNRIRAISEQLIAEAHAADREPVIRFEPTVRRR